MNDWSAVLSRISLLQGFVEEGRGHACRIFCYQGKGDDLNRPVGLRVVGDTSLWIAANGFDDTIEIGDAALSHITEADTIETAASGRWSDLNGRSIVSAWLLTNQRGYTDGLQFCFSDSSGRHTLAQFLVLGSRLSLRTSYGPSTRSDASSLSDQKSVHGRSDNELERLLGMLLYAVDEFGLLSDVLYRRVRSAVGGIVLVFGERALDVRFVESEVQMALLSDIPGDCESASSDEAWCGLLGSGLMWLWCLIDVAGCVTGIQAEFWRSGSRVGTRQVIAIDEGLNVLKME